MAASGCSSFVKTSTAFATSLGDAPVGVLDRRRPPRPPGRGALVVPVLVQSDSNVSISFFTAFGSRTMRPTSRRESSSAVRRLWLPTKAWRRSRMIVRVWSRVPASFCTSNEARPDTWPMTLTSTPAFARSCRIPSISLSEIMGS